MIPVLNSTQIKDLDNTTIMMEPVSSAGLMERAGKAFVQKFCKLFSRRKKVIVFCGQGNNGGDGLVIARLLAQKKYNLQVFVILQTKTSADFETNHTLLQSEAKIAPRYISSLNDFPQMEKDAVIIDAIFGTGLNKSLRGVESALAEHLNATENTVVSVDIPSGFLPDRAAQGNVVKANYTITFQVPKKLFFFPSSYPYVGDWMIVDIGLDKKKLRSINCNSFYLEEKDVVSILKPRNKFDHKGTFGHALIVAGSKGKYGAAHLASKACLYCGAGLTTVQTPSGGLMVLQNNLPDAMCIPDINEDEITEITAPSFFSAIAIGCGIGTKQNTAAALFFLLNRAVSSMVIDADALNLIAYNREWLNFIPEESILTPHLKEFDRLFGNAETDLARHEMQLKMSVKYKVVIILKGAYTCISLPGGKCFFNSTGNPGMAKGGSGDVLTGMIVSFLAQGYSASESSILAVFLHGRAGDLAVKKTGPYSLTASVLVDHIPQAFQSLLRSKEDHDDE